MAGWGDFIKLLNSNSPLGSSDNSSVPGLGAGLKYQSYQNPTGLMQYNPSPVGSGNVPQNQEDQHQSALNQLSEMYKQMLADGTTGGAALGQGMSQPMSIADQLQQQLNGIQVQTTPLDQLQSQANSTVSAQYDPQINQLLRDMGSTKTRATSNETEARQMYNALSADTSGQIPGQQQQNQADQAATTARYTDAKSNLQGQYDQQKTDQANVLQQLGIQAAAPDANKQQTADQSYFQQQNNLSQNQALDQLTSQGTADTSYLQQQANTEKLAGTNASNDIAAQLEAYLQNAQGKVSDLKGSKANSIAALVQQLQTADQTNAQNSYNNQFNQMMQLNNLQRGLTNDQTSAQNDAAQLAIDQQNALTKANASGFAGTSGMSGMSNYLAGKYPNNPNEASTLSTLVDSVLSNPDVQNGRRTNGTSSVPITNEYLIQLLRNQAGQAGVTNSADINNAIDALLAYKGQLK